MFHRIGVDIGGTFTDFALFDDHAREIVTHKALTTPADPAEAVIAGVEVLTRRAGIRPADVAMVVHGTTLVTNAIIERRGAPTAMVVTRGFRDVMDIATESRYDLFDLRLRFPTPVVPRELRFEVAERVKWDGSIDERLELDGLRDRIAGAMETHGVRSIAVCLLHSYVNPVHEQRIAHWLAAQFPRLAVSASADIFPFMREYARWTTACLNAYVQPAVDEYLDRLDRGLAGLGFRGRFLIMSSSGSTLTPAIARRFPVRLLESGPAAGVLMSARHSRDLELPQILSFDMGGTTAKGCMIRDHTPLKRYDFEVARVHEFKRGSGLPVKIPVLDMIEIGSGGGSLAALDDRGMLAVGPRSAGADPGPACYGRGGRRPTLTDANLVLGYLDSSSFLGGTMALDRGAAVAAIEADVARPLALPVDQAAFGIHEVINEDVAKAFRVHASERGVDYRRCSMVVFGGSGPIHGTRIARKLGIPRVICPSGAGVMSAFGLLTSPIGFERVQSLRVGLDALGPERFGEIVDALVAQAMATVNEAGVADSDCEVAVKVDMRYIGQGYEVEVPVHPGAPAQALAALPGDFRQAYAAIFGLAFDDRAIEVVAWKVEVCGPIPGAGSPYRLKHGARASQSVRGERQAYFPDLGGYVSCAVYDRYAFLPGQTIEGPALIEEAESTCVLGTGDRAFVDESLNLIIDVQELPG
jgi:N-methylhydantoinase A